MLASALATLPTLPAFAKDIRIQCEMTHLAQFKRIIAPLHQHPWALEFFLNESHDIVRVKGPLTQTISRNPIVTVVTGKNDGKIKVRWTLPALRAPDRKMAGSYQFQASLNLTNNTLALWAGDDRPHGTNPAFVTGVCRRG